MPTDRSAVHLLLVGGGHSHVEVLRRFALHPVPVTRVTLVSRGVHTPYSGMLPGLIAGHYQFSEAHIDLTGLAHRAGAELIVDEAAGLDPVAHVVHCRSGRAIEYDLLSINIGSTPNLSVPGAAIHALPVKPISSLLERWDVMHSRVRAHDVPRRIGVVGGGAGGVELILAVQYRLWSDLRAAGRSDAHLTYHLFTPSLLPTHNARAREALASILTSRGIHVHTGAAVREATGDGLLTADDLFHPIDEVLWVTEAAAAGWVGEAGLAVDTRGFVRVDERLQSVSHPDVFAAGDIAAVDGHDLPKSGVVAVRQGPYLASNLRRASLGSPLRRYRPQRRYLSLISTGNKYAVASRGAWSVRGRWAWHMKDRIDRRFMRRYTTPPRP
jgi:selenide,water dikinase